MSFLKRLFKPLFCEHEYVFKHNIYGDAINWCGGHRSFWVCKKCGKPKYEDFLFNVENE